MRIEVNISLCVGWVLPLCKVIHILLVAGWWNTAATIPIMGHRRDLSHIFKILGIPCLEKSYLFFSLS